MIKINGLWFKRRDFIRNLYFFRKIRNYCHYKNIGGMYGLQNYD